MEKQIAKASKEQWDELPEWSSSINNR